MTGSTNSGNRTQRPYREVSGFAGHVTGELSMSINFDQEMFEEIKAFARRDNVSFAEQVRTLIQWGLEADNAP